jgi:hypothetical protein
MAKLNIAVVVLLFAGLCCAQNSNVTITGKLQGANGLPAANDIISLTPSQQFFVAGSGGNPGVFFANPGVFGAGLNNLFTTSTVGTQTANQVLTNIDTTFGIAICCLTDALTGAMTVPSAATGVQADAVAGYIQNNSSTLGGGVGGGAVGGYFVSVCNASGASCWGANPLVADVAGHPAAKLFGVEIDTNVANATTVGSGVIFNGNFTAQPSNFPTINIVKPFSAGTYTDGLRINDGATSNGLAVNIGATGTGNSVNSQTVTFAGRDSGGGGHLVSLSGASTGNGALNISTGLPPTLTATATVQVFNGVPSGACPNTTLGINAAAASATTVLYVCPAGTSTWTSVNVP